MDVKPTDYREACSQWPESEVETALANFEGQAGRMPAEGELLVYLERYMPEGRLPAA